MISLQCINFVMLFKSFRVAAPEVLDLFTMKHQKMQERWVAVLLCFENYAHLHSKTKKSR